jgi:hypothetical protein
MNEGSFTAFPIAISRIPITDAGVACGATIACAVSSETYAEVRYRTNVILLAAHCHVADRHVFDHPPPRWRHLLAHQ